jgi:hypothetical protein
LQQESQEIQGEEHFDAARVLEKDRGDIVHGLDLLEALLDGGLTLVGLQYFEG